MNKNYNIFSIILKLQWPHYIGCLCIFIHV